jgi:hypothetical protein
MVPRAKGLTSTFRRVAGVDPRPLASIPARAVVAYLAALGLGASAAAARDELSLALGVAGALAAGAAVAGFAARGGERLAPAALAALGLLAGGAGMLSETAVAPLYLCSFVALLTSGSGLVSQAVDSLRLTSSPGTLSEPAFRPTIDSLGRAEVARARRYERPLTVGSIRLPRANRRALAGVAAQVRQSLRATDLVGYGRGGRLLVIFVESTRTDAFDAWQRVRAASESVRDLPVGFASFPEDNPTWCGLVGLAEAHEYALSGGEAQELRPALSGREVPNEA